MIKPFVCILIVAAGCANAFMYKHPYNHHQAAVLAHEPVVPVEFVKHTTSSAFRPASFLEVMEVVLDCFNTLRIPLQRFPSYLSGIFPEDPETKCFLRCVAIKLGVYCDEKGADLDRHCVQFGLGECCENFSNRHLVCLQQNSLPCPDRCTAAYKQELCFQEPIAKYLDYHFHDLVGLLHQAKCSHDLKMLHP